MNELLYGRSDEERIVGVAPADDGFVWVYSRTPEDEVTSRKDRVSYLIWTNPDGAAAARRETGRPAQMLELAGGNYYNRLLVYDDRRQFSAARKFLHEDETLNYYTVSNPADSYLHQSGNTFFKGMKASDVLRMQVDIETFRLDGFAQAEHDPIIIIAMSDNRGWRKVLYWRDEPVKGFDKDPYRHFYSEADMLAELVRWVHRKDPDVIEGHNILSYDLPYIAERMKQQDVNFGIGRDGRAPFTYPAEKKFAERDLTYTNFLISGRSVVDTMFLAYDWDVFKRELENFRLKDVAQHIGVAAEGRVYVEGDQIAQTWVDKPGDLLKYALDDVVETGGLSDHFIGSTFALTQMVPLTFQRVHLAGKAATIQALFVREYLRRRHSLPLPEAGMQEHGGYTDIFQIGLFNRVWYADVASLYPSIMLNYDVRPETDELQIFQTLLRSLTDLRFVFKREMLAAEKDSAKEAELEAKQAAIKVIINSYYGMLGAGHKALFSQISEADRVAFTGQGLLKLMIEFIQDAGGDIIEVDTDGVLFIAPEDKEFETDGPAFCSMISEMMPKGIEVDFDGAYARMFSVAKKNYALLDTKGKVKVKGGALKSRGLEPIYRDFITDLIVQIVKGDASGLRDIYRRYVAEIIDGTEPARLAKTVNLKDSLETYLNKVEEGQPRRAAYEIALTMKRAGHRIGKGDRIPYVITGTEKPYKVRSFVAGKHLDWVKPGDENKLYYIQKLYGVAVKRFSEVLAPVDVARLFDRDVLDPAQTDMFGDYVRTDLLKRITIKNTRLKSPVTT